MPMDLHSLIARNRPPPLFYPALYLFNLFPLHAPLTLWGMDAPYGRFGQGGEGSWLYMNGNLAWFLMEVTSPITLVVTLWATQRPLSAVAKLCTGLFVLHYTHRSILSPLVYSPRRSLQHVAVPLSAGLFNLLNGYLIACGLAFFPPTHSLSDIRTVIGVAGFLMSFAGNVYHDEVLNDLRRPRDRRLVSSLSPEEEKGDKQAAARNGKEGGRYLIPRAGLFGLIMSPNYFCEILEWTFFALIALPPPSPSLSALPQTFLLPVPALHIVRSQLAASPWALKALSYLPEAAWPNVLIAPPWLFALNAAANMTPRAIRGLAWYRRTFGDRIPEGRKAIVPFLL